MERAAQAVPVRPDEAIAPCRRAPAHQGPGIDLTDATAPTLTATSLPAHSLPAGRTESVPPGPARRPVSDARVAERLRPLLRPAGYYLASRVAVVVAALVAATAFPRLRVVQALGSVWDGHWYLMIAQHGYPHHLGSRWAFFPAFPAAVRAVAEVTRLGLPQAAVAAAFLFGLTSALAVWLAVREVFGARLADRAVLLYVFCPTAYVLSMAYTEGLFITVAAGCLFALSRRYWVTAALCACVAGLTRNSGLVVVLAVLVTALPAARRERSLRPAVAAALARRPALVHGVRLGHGRHACGVPDLGALLGRTALRLVHHAHQGPLGGVGARAGRPVLLT